MGGGTTDVSVLNINGGIIEVIASAGNTHLGGQDLDELLVKHCMTKFKNDIGVNLKNNNRAIARLRNHCRTAKHTLSSETHTLIEID